MHGLIVSQAYGVPAQWVQFARLPIHEDDGHKFRDYFLGSNQINQTPLVIEKNRFEDLVKIKNIEPVMIRNFFNQDELLEKFPFEYYG